MILRYKVGFMEHIIDAERVEIEDVGIAEVKDGKWLFKDDGITLKGDTYSVSCSEVTE